MGTERRTEMAVLMLLLLLLRLGSWPETGGQPSWKDARRLARRLSEMLPLSRL